MSIEQSINKLVKAVNKTVLDKKITPEQYFDVIASPSCKKLFGKDGAPIKNPPINDICDALNDNNTWIDPKKCPAFNPIGHKCSPSEVFKSEEKIPSDGKLITSKDVARACENYANAQVAAIDTRGMSKSQIQEIKSKAKCSCYDYSLYSEQHGSAWPKGIKEALTNPAPNSFIPAIYPGHLSIQTLDAYKNKCSAGQIHDLCIENSIVVRDWNRACGLIAAPEN